MVQHTLKYETQIKLFVLIYNKKTIRIHHSFVKKTFANFSPLFLDTQVLMMFIQAPLSLLHRPPPPR